MNTQANPAAPARLPAWRALTTDDARSVGGVLPSYAAEGATGGQPASFAGYMADRVRSLLPSNRQVRPGRRLLPSHGRARPIGGGSLCGLHPAHPAALLATHTLRKFRND